MIWCLTGAELQLLGLVVHQRYALHACISSLHVRLMNLTYGYICSAVVVKCTVITAKHSLPSGSKRAYLLHIAILQAGLWHLAWSSGSELC